MNGQNEFFRRGVVSPTACVGAGWRLIKEDYWLFLGITLVGVFLASIVPMAILAGPMMCGIYLCLLRRERGQSVSFNNLFDGFNYFVQSLIATLLMVAAAVIVIIPLYLLFFVGMFATLPIQEKGAPPDPNVPWAFFGVLAAFVLLLMLFSLAIGLLFTFTYPLIVDRKLSGVQALSTSCKAVFGNFGGVLGLTLLNALLGILGVMLCYVGAFFIMPITMAATAAAYREVFPYDDSVLETAPMDLR